MKRDTAKMLINGTVAVFLLTTGFCIGKFAKAENEPSQTYTDTVTVQSGDTLWSIADECGACDNRVFVTQVMKMNDLDSAIIYPGQQLKVIRYE